METICWTDDPEDLRQLQKNLLTEIEKQFGAPDRKNFAWVLRNAQGKIVAGVAGYSHWQWSYISQIWVSPELQGQGLGTRLLEQVERWSTEQSQLGLYIDTFDAGVMNFYLKQGYHLVGQIPDFPKGHHRYFLFRRLTANS